jgi:hypothetical protein
MPGNLRLNVNVYPEEMFALDMLGILGAMARKDPILTPEWMHDCARKILAKYGMNEDYVLEDATSIEKDDPYTSKLRRRLGPIYEAVFAECIRGQKLHGDILSLREGHSILQEEFDELWDEIKADRLEGVKEESVHVAAVALRIVLDVVEENYQK